jgi:hypothetical protein
MCPERNLPEPGGPGWYDLVITSISELCRAHRTNDIAELGSLVGIECDREVEVGDNWDHSALEIAVEGAHGTELPYPFSIREMLRTVDEQEWLSRALLQAEDLTESIEEIEHFPVYIWYEPPPLGTLPHLAPYPYQRACSGNTSVGTWLSRRVERNYPGLYIDIRNPDSSIVHKRTMLKTLRRRWRRVEAEQ